MESQKNEYMEYNNRRKCRNCGNPIADHIHALTQFCEREELPDGSIKSCKDDYHAEKNRIEDQPYQDLKNFYKNITKNILRLVAEKGTTVTIADMDLYQIPLHRTTMLTRPANQQTIYYYIGFAFTQLNDSQFKIINHGNEFK